MIKLKKLSVRNFMSFGNCHQVLSLSDYPMTLIQGINKDKTDNEPESDEEIELLETADASLSEKPSNGSGKSTILSALNYVLFGESIANKIKKSNLVNKTNKKNMEVFLDFEKDGVQYRIERGRSPEFLRFFVNGEDTAQGENKDTQEDINKVLGMSPDLFYQICLMTASAPTFMEMNAAGQREIIEQLLGVQILTDKAEKLKDKIKDVKQTIATEEVRLATVKSANDEIIRRNEIQKNDYKQKLDSFELDRNNQLKEYENILSSLKALDIEKEIQNHKFNESVDNIIAENVKINQSKTDKLNEINKINSNIQILELNLSNLKNINIEDEKLAFEFNENAKKNNDAIREKVVELSNSLNTKDRQLLEVQHTIRNLSTENITITEENKRLSESITKSNLDIQEWNKTIEKINSNVCPTCGAKLVGSDNQEMSKKYNDYISAANTNINESNKTISNNELKLKEISERINAQLKLEESLKNDHSKIEDDIKVLNSKLITDVKKTHYKDLQEVYLHQNKIDNTVLEINKYKEDASRLHEEYNNMNLLEVPNKVATFYKDIYQAMIHVDSIKSMETKINELKEKVNPYAELLKGCETVELMPYDDSLKKSSEDDLVHLDFLVKLLTNKDSFVRKKIVEQNLAYLNLKIKHYLTNMGSLHTVIFNPDLSFDITKFGESFDFAALSRGEKTSLILSLNFAFRDLYELINEPINVMFVDELIDNGLDKYTAYNVVNILQRYSEQNKNVFVVSHRKDIQARMNRILTVVMELGFSEIKGNINEN